MDSQFGALSQQYSSDMPTEGGKALLVIDVQNDFLPGGSLAAPGADRIIPVVNALLGSPLFDLRVASSDWHPEVRITLRHPHSLV